MTSPHKPSLLIVEDDSRLRKTLELEFLDRGYEVHTALDLKGLKSLSIEKLQFAILDLRLGAESGLSALEYLREVHPNCRMVVITGYGSIATTVAAMKLGAVNYLTKPFHMSELEHCLWVDSPENDIEPMPHQRESLDRHEREYIEHVLVKCGGNISQAAKWLNIHRQSLQRKLKKFSSL